jgi:transcriptional regulator with XRE-family HTH domain
MESGTLGERLRARRVALGLTLAQVAERAELSLPYVSNLERGRGNPTIEALRAIAAALETGTSSLLDESEAADPLEIILATAPKSLLAFAKSSRFVQTVERYAEKEEETFEAMRRRLLLGMASAPRRSKGEPTEDDWKRLLDAYSLILDG